MFSPDSKKAVVPNPSGLGDSLDVYDTERGNVLFSLQKQGAQVVFSADSKKLALFNYGGNTVVLCDATTGKTERSFQLTVDTATLFSVYFSPDGRLIQLHATSGGDLVFDVKTGQAKPIFDGSEFVLFSPDGKTDRKSVV